MDQEEATRYQLKALLDIGDVIVEFVDNKGEVPSGELYALAMVGGITIDVYQSLISLLVSTGRIKLSNHLLISVKGD